MEYQDFMTAVSACSDINPRVRALDLPHLCDSHQVPCDLLLALPSVLRQLVDIDAAADSKVYSIYGVQQAPFCIDNESSDGSRYYLLSYMVSNWVDCQNESMAPSVTAENSREVLLKSNSWAVCTADEYLEQL